VIRFSLGVLVGALALSFGAPWQAPTSEPSKDAPRVRLGNFSVSLAVKDIAASRAFYEKLGFREVGGDEKQRWLVLQNESATVGLFQGFFEKNALTFNPGWDRSKKTLADFDDVRAIQRQLEAAGLKLTTRADESTLGPAHFMLVDPDGNPILVDQHVPAPAKK
jgi:catechol 2,3-dioxygenase-like lactoylglutathione lyase family enzyme